MKDEIRRIMNMVKEGRLSPEDAAELIDAITANEDADNGAKASGPESGTSGDDAKGERTGPEQKKDPVKSFVDFVESLGKEVTHNVDWPEVARQIREGAKRGAEGLRQGLEQVSKGKWTWSWSRATEEKVVTLPLGRIEGKLLKIENSCGDVKVVGNADRGEVVATARIRGVDEADAKAKADSYTLMVEESEHEVLIKQPDVSGLTVDLSIKIAGTGNVEIRSNSGDIDVQNTGGSCRIHTHSGDIQMRGLNGPVEAHVQSGDLRLENTSSPSVSVESASGDLVLNNVSGNIRLRSASGDLIVRDCSGKTVSIETVSGDTVVDLVEPVSGTVNIRSVNGNSILSIVDGSDCRVSLSTLRGEVFCSVPLADEHRSEAVVSGRMGDGLGSIDVSAINGDVHLKLRDHSEPAS
ncbi:MAG: DUF4097 family beta strand repeat-containing protein [Fimbriimonadaceae bacterium]